MTDKEYRENWQGFIKLANINKRRENNMYKINMNSYPNAFDKLVFYSPTGVVFEKTRDINNIFGIGKSGSLNSTLDKINSIELPYEPRNARKETFNKGDVFFLSYSCDYLPSQKRRALYIPISLISVINEGEYIALEHNGEKDYLKRFRLIVSDAIKINIDKYHCEKLNLPADFKISEEEARAGWHWSRGLGDYNNAYNLIDEDRARFLEKRTGEKYNCVKWWKTEEAITELYYPSDFYHKNRKRQGARTPGKNCKRVKCCIT